ncbi:hypothetical protein ABT167_35725 [Streptomyces sp. NPDC001792]|uniref:hypothetical protein n=1 Tax=Streptomyces sp. NPDC001792 TaxID=3154524 RepID=UPI003320B661
MNVATPDVRVGDERQKDLEAAAAELNRRPRKTLGWDTPAERFAGLLMNDPNTRVATIC